MTQGDKNKLLIILLFVLVALSVFLVVYDRPDTGSIVQKDRYAVADTSSVSKITMRSEALGLDNVLQRTDKGWTINGQHKADPNIVRVLFAVLHQVRIARPVPKTLRGDVQESMRREGIEVKIYSGEQVVKSFLAHGNNTKTQTVFAQNPAAQPHFVVLPGYDSYVAGIFEVTALDWRDRTIFHSTWRSLQRLEILYPDQPEQNVEIRFTIDFFEITGIEQIDTTAMMEFLEDLQYFQATRFIQPQEGSAYDSLWQTEPHAIISVDDVIESRNNRVMLFPALPEDEYNLGMVGTEQFALFSRNSVDNILKMKRDFMYYGGQ
jgi:hypothetical protein